MKTITFLLLFALLNATAIHTLAQEPTVDNDLIFYNHWYDDFEGKLPDNFPAISRDAPKINKPNIKAFAGLSVNSYSGSLFYDRHDLLIPGRGLSLDVSFYYNSSNTSLDLGYGPGWSMTYSMKCIPDSQSVLIRMADGQKHVFLKTGTAWKAPKGVYDSLYVYQPGKYILRTKGGLRYYFEDSTHHGLTRMVDRHGNTIQITYNAGLPVMITDASGRSLNFNYTNAHLAQITDPNFSPARNILFQYDGAGNPVLVTDPLGNAIQYQYDVVHNMTRLTDKAGTQYNISYLNCATVEQVSSPLNALRFRFNSSDLSCIDSMQVSGAWQKNVSRFDNNGNLVEKVANCCGYHWYCEYDSLNNLVKRTDAKGYETHFTWDTHGNLLSSVDPMQGTKVFQYEPLYHQLTYFKNENNQVTIYSYDTAGNLLQVQKPLGITESRTYNAFGQPVTYTDGNGYSRSYTYNTHGDLTAIHKPMGATETFTYDNVGNCLGRTNANGHTSTWVYDQLNRPIQWANALSQVTLWQYDARGLLLSSTDPAGHVVSHQYDVLGRQVQTTTPAGTSLNTYDEYGNVKTQQDAKGYVMHNTYDTKNRLVAQTNAMGKTRTFAYDANGNKTDLYDYNGNHREYEYDTMNRLVRQVDPVGHSTWFSYDALGNRISTRDANLHTTTFTFDALNRLTQVQRPIGTTLFEYDANNNRTKRTDANAHTTLFTYDSLNRLASITDPLSHHTGYRYDAMGNCLTDTDRNGAITQHTYDALNRIVKTTTPTGITDSTGYNSDGLCAIRRVGGLLVWYTYDAMHRLTGQYDSIGTIETTTYDANSNRLVVKNGKNDSTRYAYDSIDRVTTIIDPAGNSTRYAYDNNSNVLFVVDRKGDTTRFVYDADDRLITTISALGLVSSKTYDPVDNVLSITDPKMHTTTFAYDANDQLLSETLPDGNAQSYTYDLNGNRQSRTDFNGIQTHYTYDANDQLLMRNYPGNNDDAFTYDNEGNLLTANNSNASISRSYDNEGRLLSETLNGKTVSYSYDVPNKKRTITYPGGRVIEYRYDNRLRLEAIRENNANMAVNTYDGANDLISTSLRNGVTENYAYDVNQWMSSLNQKRGTDTITAFTHQFDPVGNKRYTEKKHRLSNGEKYTYDKDSRLTQYKEGILLAGEIASPLKQTQYTFDSAGNRVSVIKTTVVNPAANNYVFSTGTATLDPMSGATTLLNANNDDNPSALIPIGFAFQYEGLSYNVFSVTPDGFMRLGTTAVAEPVNNMISLVNRPKLMPMWDNLATGTNGNVKMLLTGAAGSRILKIQWMVTIPRNLLGGANSLFQVWLYESSGVIEFRYGPGGNPSGGATIGINGAATVATNFISVSSSNHTASTTTANNANITWPGSNRYYRFTPPAGSAVVNSNYFSNIVNQYTTVDTTNPVYDANGNTLNNGISVFQYDYENRCTVVNPFTLNSTSSLYDALGRRIQKANATGSIRYFYDGDRVIEERDNANTVQATYVYQEQETLSASDQEIGVFNMQRGGNDYFLHCNSIGSVVAVTDMNGNVAERYEYDEYGKPSFFDAVYGARTATAIGNTYLFRGMSFDAESGHYYAAGEPMSVPGSFDGNASNTTVSVRAYNPKWGRFAQRSEGSGINKYVYAANNPINTFTNNDIQFNIISDWWDRIKNRNWWDWFSDFFNKRFPMPPREKVPFPPRPKFPEPPLPEPDPLPPVELEDVRHYYYSIDGGRSGGFLMDIHDGASLHDRAVGGSNEAMRRTVWKYWIPYYQALAQWMIDLQLWIVTNGRSKHPGKPPTPPPTPRPTIPPPTSK